MVEIVNKKASRASHVASVARKVALLSFAGTPVGRVLSCGTAGSIAR